MPSWRVSKALLSAQDACGWRCCACRGKSKLSLHWHLCCDLAKPLSICEKSEIFIVEQLQKHCKTTKISLFPQMEMHVLAFANLRQTGSHSLASDFSIGWSVSLGGKGLAGAIDVAEGKTRVVQGNNQHGFQLFQPKGFLSRKTPSRTWLGVAQL